jgi:hypothetical protein
MMMVRGFVPVPFPTTTFGWLWCAFSFELAFWLVASFFNIEFTYKIN